MDKYNDEWNLLSFVTVTIERFPSPMLPALNDNFRSNIAPSDATNFSVNPCRYQVSGRVCRNRFFSLLMGYYFLLATRGQYHRLWGWQNYFMKVVLASWLMESQFCDHLCVLMTLQDAESVVLSFVTKKKRESSARAIMFSDHFDSGHILMSLMVSIFECMMDTAVVGSLVQSQLWPLSWEVF